MSNVRPLYWHQGLFLQPHHLQQEDCYVQSLLSPYHRFLQPHLWGAAQIEIQESALGNRSFSLARGEFLFQDGTHVSFPGNAVIESRSFEQAWVDGEKPFKVSVGLRRLNEAGQNVTVLSALENLTNIATRFVTTTDTEEVVDLYQAGPPANMQRLHYVLKLFWETEMDQIGDYLVIPLAQLERSGDEVLLSEKFVPPCLAVTVSKSLQKIFVEIRDQMASRGHQLESYKRERGIQAAEFGARDTVYLLALRSLNRYIPLIFHLLDGKSVHPWTAFGLLRQLIGELSSFSETVTVLGQTEEGELLLPPYDHRNLWRCFSAAQSLVTRLLDDITAGPDYVIPLRYDGTYFTADLAPAIFEGRNRFFLLCDTEEDAKAVIKSLETIAKIGARESLPILIARALPGIRIQHLPIPPQELPRRTHAVYFQIDHQSDLWTNVTKGNNLALYWDSAPEDLKVELMIVGRS